MLRVETYKKGIVKSTLLNILAKGIVFLNTIVITYFFGTKIETDLYFYIITVSGLVCSIINGIDLLVIIPEAMRIREQDSEQNSRRFLNFFIWLYVGIGLIFTLLALFSPVLFYGSFSKFDHSQLLSHQPMLLIGSFFIFFQLLNGLLSSILTSYKYFTVSIYASLINCTMAIVLTFTLQSSIGILGTVLGFLLGFLINTILLLLFFYKKLKWNFLAVGVLRNKIVWRNILLMEINILPVLLRNYLILYMLTGLGVGVITAVNLAMMIVILPESLLLAQVASVGGIKFSELFSKSQFVETKELFYQLFSGLLVIIIPVTLIITIATKDIVQLLFLRGNFNAENIPLVTNCLFFLALLTPSKIFDILYSRLFTSFQVYKTTVVYATIGHTLFTIICFLGIKYFQLQGYFFALIIGCYFIIPIFFMLILNKRLAHIRDSRIMIISLRALGLAIFIYLTSYYFYHSLSSVSIFLRLILISLFVLVMYIPSLIYFGNYSFLSDHIKNPILKKKFRQLFNA